MSAPTFELSLPDVASPSPQATAPPMDAATTAKRLGIASLGYLMAMTLVVTLTPFRFASVPVHGFTSLWTPTDLVMNVVMFLPLGFLFSLSRRRREFTVPLAFVIGLGFSTAIESAQLFEHERYTSLLDIATNGMGALLGALAHDLMYGRLSRTAAGVAPVRAMALELPLMGLVYLLVPLLWLVGLGAGEGGRIWLSLPVCAFGGAILGAVHGGYLAPLRGTSIRALMLAASAWAGVAGIMIMRRNLVAFGACAAIVVCTALLQSWRASQLHRLNRNRRFELPTLRMVLPLFAAYLALAALWPLDGADLLWRAGVHFFPAGTMPVDIDVYRALEHIAAFTLVGYVIAEVRGRADRPYGDMVQHVAAWGTGLALLLEFTRGLHPMYGASVLLCGAASAASIFGGWMYYLQRDHVRALAAAAHGAAQETRAR